VKRNHALRLTVSKRTTRSFEGSLLVALLLCACNKPEPVSRIGEGTPPEMVLIPAGTYSLGAGQTYPEERPTRRVTVAEFMIDRTEVTNAQFQRFVQATGYVTFAERSSLTIGDPPAGSACCRTAQDTKLVTDRWVFVAGANWTHPGGIGTSIEGRMNFPVVHVTYEDALAYARWSGKDLATGDEWEVAARGGLVDQKYEWGHQLTPNGKWMANIYQGKFPWKDLGLDGFAGLAPVASYPPNGYGLYDMTGNSWELIKDAAPKEAASGQECRLAKGGSFLCASNYCARFRPAAFIPVTIDTSTEHIGFRCVRRTTTLGSRK
jgi:formylglycine-generating enzyme